MVCCKYLLEVTKWESLYKNYCFLVRKNMTNQPENRKRVYEAFSAGLDSPEIVAYHGTSLSVLKRIIETGRHGDPKGSLQYYRAGEIFVYPIAGRAVLPFSMEMFTDEEAQEEASLFAKTHAMEHCLAEKLGIDPIQATYGILLEGFVEDGNFLKKVVLAVTGREYSRTEASKLYDELKTKRGLIIGYSQRILDCGEPLQLTEEKENPAVRVINVDISFLVGIEPLDQESYDYLSSLEAQLQCMAD